MMPANEDNDVQVTWEDQKRINQFSRLNSRQGELKADLKSKQEELTLLTDAQTDMLLSDDELIFYRVGEVYARVPKDEAEQMLEKQTNQINDQIAKITEEINKNSSGMTELKVILYAHLKNAINLESE
eukprot:TRINITY_DN1166_c0_g1_i2.p1 TRINITY_DN1166_c0_g1~~TRINITY_DN1166_c0_g1_i2.p1  ORF type:complete len:149 (+),score=46.90 TRINITY_DN1166_c0_g1_i2:66-449(+)